MKKVITLFCFLFFTFNYSSAQGIWTWMSGDTNAISGGVYGTQGIPSVNNHPPALYSPYCWTDKQGKFWLYGGLSDSSDWIENLWKFDPTTLEWTWMKGSNTSSGRPIYGKKGVPSATNTPGGRSFSGCTWLDTSGNLWLFSGDGLYDDLWRYNIPTNEWTWISGDSGTLHLYSNFGTQGVPSLSNQPSGRWEIGSSWVDANGKFWLYSGYNYEASADMWMYDPITNMWTWESGYKTYSLPIGGAKGSFSPSYTPGTKWPYSMWTDDKGNLWLFGGNYQPEMDPGGFGYPTNNLWEYNPLINQWALINSQKKASSGAPCQKDSSFYPEPRYENRATWKDRNNNVWMFGGIIYYAEPVTKYVGDMWVYLTTINEWARMSTSSYLDSLPVFGSKGVPSISNHPGARAGCTHWQDLQGNFWIFSGVDSLFYGDMWRYTPDLSCITGNSPGKIVAVPDSVCIGGSSLLNVVGSSGAIQWESSLDGTSYTIIPGATSTTYSATNIVQKTYFRVNAPWSGGTNYSLSNFVSVIPLTIAGNISAMPDSVCKGSSTLLVDNGIVGTPKWQSSTNGLSFTNISLADSTTYNSPNLTETTYYRVKVSNTCGVDSSSVIVISLNPLPFAGIFTSNLDTICSGSSSILSITGSIGNIQWQSSNDGISFTDISLANSVIYNAPNLLQSTYFRVIASNSCGNNTSAIKAIIVNPNASAGMVASNPDTVCSGSSSQLIVARSAGNIQWQSSNDGISFSDISSVDSNIYVANNLFQTTYYRVIASNSCGVDSSSVVKVDVAPLPIAGILSSNRDNICIGTGVTSRLNVSGSLGNIQWQASSDSIYFSIIPNDTSNVYTTPRTLAQTTYYRVIVQNGNCGIDTSNIVAVHIVPSPSTNFIYTTNGRQISFQADSVTGGVISYKWNFGDGQMSNDTNPVHTFDSIKTYYVCLTVYNGSNCSFTRCQYVSAPNGVRNVSSPQNFIRIYPNPANEQLTVDVLNGEAPKQITITNDLGQTLIQLNTNKTKTQIDIHSLSTGIYFVKTQLGDGSLQVRKFVKE